MSVMVGEFEKRSGLTIWREPEEKPVIRRGRLQPAVLAIGFRPDQAVPRAQSGVLFQDPATGERVSRVVAYQRYWSNHGPSAKPVEAWREPYVAPPGTPLATDSLKDRVLQSSGFATAVIAGIIALGLAASRRRP